MLLLNTALVAVLLSVPSASSLETYDVVAAVCAAADAAEREQIVAHIFTMGKQSSHASLVDNPNLSLVDEVACATNSGGEQGFYIAYTTTDNIHSQSVAIHFRPPDAAPSSRVELAYVMQAR